ncbi:MAG TPA: class I SAM-dependent methyltransferase [Candidatus Saccharimonadales bacterium]
MSTKGSVPDPAESPRFSDEILAQTFDTGAEIYDSFRPGYANNAFKRLIELTGLDDGAQVLEIGSGAGQATLPMAERGYDLTTIEPGTNLADVTRKKLQPYPNARLIIGKLEDVDLPPESFDLIYSAMALHWVAEERRFAKPHQLLKPGGYLALLSNEPVTDEAGDRFAHALLSIRKRYGLVDESTDFERLLEPGELYHLERTPIDSGLFEEIDRTVFAFDLEPRTGLDHAMYMHTLSEVLAMPEAERMAFLGEIKALIETEFDDQLDYRYATTLIIARKR